MGSPRSGTTFLATKISERVSNGLLPEAQWLIEGLTGRSTSDYSKSAWGVACPAVEQFCIDNNSIKEVVKNFTMQSGWSASPEVWVEHTPQNILHLRRIKSVIDVSMILSPLRRPSLSVRSLVNQPWFKGGTLRAAYFNLKCMFALYVHRSRIVFVDLQMNELLLEDKLDRYFSARNFDSPTGSFRNAVIEQDQLLRSHAFLRSKKSRWGGDVPMVYEIVTLPAYLIYRALLRRVEI